MAIYWLDVDGNFTNTANWSGGAAPANGDTVYILSGSQNIATNLNQSAVTLANLVIGMGFTGTIGTSSAYLQINSTLWSVGVPAQTGSPTGSGRIKLDFGSAQFTGIVYNTSVANTDSYLEPLRIKGTHASNKLTVLSGLVGVGTTLATETSTINQADVDGGKLQYGFGVTWVTVNVAAQATFFSQSGGGTSAVLTTAPSSTATVNGSTKIVTINAGGTTNINMRPGAGDVATTINLYATGTIDFTGNPATGTIGTLNHYKGGTWNNSPAAPNHITATSLSKVNGGSIVLS
jgi:hypothetical protein